MPCLPCWEGPGREIPMRINFAHMRERAQNGGWIDFAVFDARSSSGSDSDNAILLSQLTARARAHSLKIDQSALAYSSGRRVMFYGSPSLVEFLSKSGVPRWTHHLDV
ncbi:hypothetical protein DID96_36550 [Burkholderia sp. Bp8963]|nr:hypothetical protein DID96_36550 [Burkholderia sp. Bp8963]